MKKMFGFMAGLTALFTAVPVFAGDGKEGGGSGGMLVTFLPFIILIVAFYFLLIRPQKKQEKAKREMLNSLEKGDEVSTIGGVIGKVVKVKEDRVVIETGSDCVKITFERGAIGRVTKKNEKKSKDNDVNEVENTSEEE